MTYTEIIEAEADEPELSDSEKKALAIIKDVSDRRGLRQEWEQIDSDIQDEIFATWVNIIEN